MKSRAEPSSLLIETAKKFLSPPELILKVGVIKALKWNKAELRTDIFHIS